MKSLNEYIENNIVDLDINDSLDLHFYAEFILQDSMRYTITSINEKYGSYIGQKELILKVARDIYANDNKFVLRYTKDDLKEYSNIFFDELRVVLHTNSTAYMSTASKFDKSRKMFDKVVISLTDENLDSLQEICSSIMHEMLHAYNHYMEKLTGAKTSLDDLSKAGTPYSKAVLASNKLTPENICKRMLHDIRLFEQNAYFSELTNLLELNKFNVNDFENTVEAYKHAKKLFKESLVWKQYIFLYERLNEIKTNKDFQKEFADTYNEINDVKWTFDKIYKKLYFILENIIKKFETTISKLFCDYYQRQLNEHIEHERQKYGAFCGRSKLFVDYMQLYNEYDVELNLKKDEK